MNSTTQKGFTLVEIAMVFIVIALIMGGVLKVQEMITNTRLKQVGSSQAGLLASLNLYYDRYRQFPGDDPSAEQHFTIYNGQPAVNGDGDGEVGIGNDWDLDETTTITVGEQETLKFFAHLRAAGFIEGVGTTFKRPRHPLDAGHIGIQSGSLGMSEHVVVFGGLEGEHVRILDAWHDNADTETGVIRSATVSDGIEFADVPTSPFVLDDRYNLAWRLAGQ